MGAQQGPPSELRDLFMRWIEACVEDEDAPEKLAPNLLGADLEEIVESAAAIAKNLQDLLEQSPSWDVLESALYDAWSDLVHLVGHWKDLVSAVEDPDLRIESYFEEDGSSEDGDSNH